MGTLTTQQNKGGAAIKEMFASRSGEIAEAIGKNPGLTVERFASLAMGSLRDNPALLNCSQASLWKATMHAANARLPIGGPLPLAYIVPYKTECQLIISYRGWMEMVRRSGEVKNIATGVVHEGDEFIPPDDALDPKLIHKQSTDPKRHEKPVTHVWAGYLFHNGTRIYEVMTADEAMAHGREFSPSYSRKDSPWQTSPIPMMLKTVIMRPIKRGLVPVSTDAEGLYEVDEHVIEGEATLSVETPVQIEQHPAEEETPPDLDKAWFDKELNKKMSGRDLLAFRNECLETYTNDRQFIFEACEEHDKQIRNQEQ